MPNNETYIKVLQDKLENLKARCRKSAIYNFENGNYAGLFIVTADDLKNDDKAKKLKCELDKTYNQLMEVEKESQERIAELESELEAKVNFETDRLVKLPFDALETANILINATYNAEIPFLEKQVDRNVYDIDDLEQIAEHLLVYCKHNREDEE